MYYSSRIRKYESGYEKHKKKKKIEQFVQTQAGALSALDRFIIKEHQTSTEDQTPRIGGDDILVITQTIVTIRD
jgi:hypothetical protein